MTPISPPTDDYYTRAIIGDRLVLKLGRPVVSHPAASPFDWKPSIAKKQSKPSLLVRSLAAVGVLVVGVALITSGVLLASHFGFDGPAPKDDFPVGAAGDKSGSVRVIDQDYAPVAPAQQPVLTPLQAMPSPLPIDDSQGVPLPVSPPQVNTPPSSVKKADKDAAEKQTPSVVVVDDGPSPKATPQQTVAPAKAADKPTAPAPAKQEPPAKPTPPSATLPPPQKGGKPAEGAVKFAAPVDEKPVGGSSAKAQAPEAKREEGGVKITIVDITPGGKAVLVTNPSTRLPTKLGVGDKLPNGKTIQAIDEKTGSVTADGSTYKLD